MKTEKLVLIEGLPCARNWACGTSFNPGSHQRGNHRDQPQCRDEDTELQRGGVSQGFPARTCLAPEPALLTTELNSLPSILPSLGCLPLSALWEVLLQV